MKERIVSYLPESIIRRLRHPKEATIEVSNLCNLNCVVCPTPNLNRKRGIMDYDDFKIIMNKLPESIRTVRFNWAGEPLTNRDVFKMVGYTNIVGKNVHISTNATLLDNFEPEELAINPHNSISVCIDGNDKETHETFRRNSNFKRTLKNIRYLQKHFTGKMILQTLVWKGTWNKRAEIIELGKGLGMDEIHFRYFSLTMKNREEMKELAQELLPPYEYSIYDEDMNVKNPYEYCMAFLDPVILWNGDMTTCCLDYEGMNVYANLLRESWDKAWPKNPRKKIIKKKFPICRTCNISKFLNLEKVRL